MNESQMTRAFNEWMRRYTEDPEQFEREIATVRTHLFEHSAGMEPTYGQTSAAYLQRLNAELTAAGGEADASAVAEAQ